MKQNVRLFILLSVLLLWSVGCAVVNAGSGTTSSELASSVIASSEAVSSKEVSASSVAIATTSSTDDLAPKVHHGAIPTISYEEYFAEERDWQYGWYLSSANLLEDVYQGKKIGPTFGGKYRLFLKKERFVYKSTPSGVDYRLLFENVSALSNRSYDGYQYVAVGGNIIRLDEYVNWTVFYVGIKEIHYLDAKNPYVLYFHDGETLYRMFLGNYQIDEICKVENRHTNIYFLSSTDVFLETPTKEFVEFVQAGNEEDHYYGKGPLYTGKAYSTLTDKFYEIDYEKLFSHDNLTFAEEVQFQYLEKRNEDLKK